MESKIVVVPSFSVSNLACQNLSSAAGYVKLPTLTARGPNGAVPGLRFRVAKNFQKSPGSKYLKIGVNHFPKLNQTKSGRDHDQKFLMKAASTSIQPPESYQEPFSLETTWESFKGGIDAFYRFSRPHTVKGTILSIISVSLLAIERMSDFSPLFFIGVLQAVVASLFMNVYVVGINQLTDIEIDKVNKPYLPLASGEYSYRTGLLIISSFATMSFIHHKMPKRHTERCPRGTRLQRKGYDETAEKLGRPTSVVDTKDPGPKDVQSYPFRK